MSADWIGSYRLQLHAGFTLDAARQILPYLSELGVSHVYLSPCLQAVPGSQHGYDVTDPSRISDDLGGEAAWERFVADARSHQLRILLDIVPNHMSASQHNPWWDDVLAHGPFSEFADYFDIRIPPHGPYRVHICTLAHAYGESLQQGELEIELARQAAAPQAFRQQLAIGSGFLGRAARVGQTHVSPSSSVCNACSRPGETERGAVSQAGTARRADPRRCDARRGD